MSIIGTVWAVFAIFLLVVVLVGLWADRLGKPYRSDGGHRQTRGRGRHRPPRA